MSRHRRVTLYLDADVYERSLAALKKMEISMSEYVRDFLASNLKSLEIGAETQDPQKVAQAFQRDLGDLAAFQLEQMASMLRNIQAAARGEEE